MFEGKNYATSENVDIFYIGNISVYDLFFFSPTLFIPRVPGGSDFFPSIMINDDYCLCKTILSYGFRAEIKLALAALSTRRFD